MVELIKISLNIWVVTKLTLHQLQERAVILCVLRAIEALLSLASTRRTSAKLATRKLKNIKKIQRTTITRELVAGTLIHNHFNPFTIPNMPMADIQVQPTTT